MYVFIPASVLWLFLKMSERTLRSIPMRRIIYITTSIWYLWIYHQHFNDLCVSVRYTIICDILNRMNQVYLYCYSCVVCCLEKNMCYCHAYLFDCISTEWCTVNVHQLAVYCHVHQLNHDVKWR